MMTYSMNKIKSILKRGSEKQINETTFKVLDVKKHGGATQVVVHIPSIKYPNQKCTKPSSVVVELVFSQLYNESHAINFKNELSSPKIFVELESLQYSSTLQRMTHHQF